MNLFNGVWKTDEIPTNNEMKILSKKLLASTYINLVPPIAIHKKMQMETKKNLILVFGNKVFSFTRYQSSKEKGDKRGERLLTT